MTQPTLKELLLMSDFGRLQAKRERELAARGSSKSEPVKRGGDERDTKQPAR